jgi:hypothetical protein
MNIPLLAAEVFPFKAIRLLCDSSTFILYLVPMRVLPAALQAALLPLQSSQTK